MSRPDTYADFAAWRGPRPDATVGDAMREFTGTPLDLLLVWFPRHDRGAQAARETAARLGSRPGALPGTRDWLLLHGCPPEEPQEPPPPAKWCPRFDPRCQRAGGCTPQGQAGWGP